MIKTNDLVLDLAAHSPLHLEGIKPKEILIPGKNMNEDDYALFKYIKEHKGGEINDYLFRDGGKI